MSDVSTRTRQPKGVPVGGQFATETRAESGLMLEAPATPAEPDWGTTGISAGGRTPWGTADSVEDVAPGIVFASTPGHGGFKLSPERNAVVPDPLRNGNGWYE
jgi:hypothetical protein